MTRKLPADIPSPELRGATRPDMPKWQSLRKMPHDKQILFTDKSKSVQWLGMITGENPPHPEHNGIAAAYWAEKRG